MAIVKNITKDTLKLFRPDAPPIEPNDVVTVKDANFVGRAWPKSTWELVEEPEGYHDVSPEDAYLFVEPEQEPTPEEKWAAAHPHGSGRMDHPDAFTVEQVQEYLAIVDDDERERVIEVEAAGKARKSIVEWSE